MGQLCSVWSRLGFTAVVSAHIKVPSVCIDLISTAVRVLCSEARVFERESCLCRFMTTGAHTPFIHAQ